MVTDADATPKQWAESLTRGELVAQLRMIAREPHKLAHDERVAVIVVAIDWLEKLEVQALETTRLDRAEAALVKLYGDWAEHGGPSPDTRYEALTIARALGDTKFVPTNTQLDAIFELTSWGASPRQIAAAHLKALDGAS